MDIWIQKTYEMLVHALAKCDDTPSVLSHFSHASVLLYGLPNVLISVLKCAGKIFHSCEAAVLKARAPKDLVLQATMFSTGPFSSLNLHRL